MYIDKIPVPQSVCEMNSKRNNADLTLLYPYRGYMNFSQIFAMHLGDNSDHIKYIYTYWHSIKPDPIKDICIYILTQR